ncbi:MAG: hypothetical protein HY712_01880 [candidate division NC10 bacterium]|nr:hypothetical protein [candidate division NC10 bacterium]
MAGRLLGIFLEPLHAQSEGVEAMFDVLESVGTTAVALTLIASRPAAPGTGVRMPPLHVDGHRRVYARPVWGQDSVVVETFPAEDPDLALFSASGYSPRRVAVPAEVDRSVPRRMIAEARRRGMRVYAQIKPFIPPGVRPADQPVYPDGAVPKPRQVAMIGSPCSPAIREYGVALVRDTVRAFPELDGLFLDWAEYGAYAFQDLFTCLGSHSATLARSRGLDWDLLAAQVRAVWERLHRLRDEDLRPAATALSRLIDEAPGWAEFLRFKAEAVTTFYRDVRRALDAADRTDVQLMGRGWPPPWNLWSGMDYDALAGVCAAATPKLFAFDYCAIPRWYGEVLQRWNPALSEAAILDALTAWLDLPDNFPTRRFDLYAIPAEDEPHPVGVPAYRCRVEAVLRAVGGRCAVQPFAHCHMPEAMWREKVRMLREAAVDGMWIQMYGYLSEPKLQILREEWRP